MHRRPYFGRSLVYGFGEHPHKKRGTVDMNQKLPGVAPESFYILILLFWGPIASSGA
jgi:hypothetical protein